MMSAAGATSEVRHSPTMYMRGGEVTVQPLERAACTRMAALDEECARPLRRCKQQAATLCRTCSERHVTWASFSYFGRFSVGSKDSQLWRGLGGQHVYQALMSNT